MVGGGRLIRYVKTNRTVLKYGRTGKNNTFVNFISLSFCVGVKAPAKKWDRARERAAAHLRPARHASGILRQQVGNVDERRMAVRNQFHERGERHGHKQADSSPQ